MTGSMLAACLLTMLVETVFFALWRDYRRGAFLALCLAVNMATNLTLNCVLPLMHGSSLAVYPLEIAIVVVEYGVYALGTGRSGKLFCRTLAANILSYTLGGLMYSFI